MRSNLLILSIVVSISLIVLPSISFADDWNRATTAIFTQPVQIPGKVLPAGIYVFKLGELSGERNVVQVWNADQTGLIATIMGWPDYLRAAPTEGRFVFEEQEKGAPLTLKAWWFGGNSSIETFVYSKRPTK